MSTLVTRAVGRTGRLQRLTWPENFGTVQVTAYLWGGGGGAGGNDTSRALGGSGSGGSYAEILFLLNPGDVLDVAIGGGGNGGFHSRGSAPGGLGGPSFVSGSISYSGGNGSDAGPVPYSGGGGGGGGATVLLLNNNVLAVAAGGGGGGGAGNPAFGVPIPSWGGSAPGLRPVGPETAGQNGQPKAGDGGGAGGGGGGAAGGGGGAVGAGDVGGGAGAEGNGFVQGWPGPGTRLIPALGRSAAFTSSPFYRSGYAFGGLQDPGQSDPQLPGNAFSGGNGFAQFQFDIPAIYVRRFIGSSPVQNVYVRRGGILNIPFWDQARAVYVRESNQWRAVLGVNPPIFGDAVGGYGRLPRPWS